MQNDHDGRAWLAWHIAALPKAKRFPKLKSLLTKRKPKPKQRRAWEEQLAIAHAWTAAVSASHVKTGA